MPAPGHKIGADNRAAVRAALSTYLGITNREIAKLIGMSPERVGRHVQAIRAEWGGKPFSERRIPLPTPPAGEGR